MGGVLTIALAAFALLQIRLNARPNLLTEPLSCATGIYDPWIMHTGQSARFLYDLNRFGLTVTRVHLISPVDLRSASSKQFPRHRLPWVKGNPAGEFDSAFWRTLRGFLQDAERLEISVVLTLFDARTDMERWDRSPWSQVAENPSQRWSLSPRLLRLEQKYVARVLDTIRDFQNVVIECSDFTEVKNQESDFHRWLDHWRKDLRARPDVRLVRHPGTDSNSGDEPRALRVWTELEGRGRGPVEHYRDFVLRTMGEAGFKKDDLLISLNRFHYRTSAPALPLDQLTGMAQTGGRPGSRSEPSLSSREIAFSSSRAGNSEIYIIRADGSKLRRVTTHEGDAYFPAWSPDGSRIAFFSSRPGGGSDDLYLVHADGTGLKRLSRTDWSDMSPSWLPDGRGILFDSDRERKGTYKLYVHDVESGKVTRFPAGSSFDGRLGVLSPDMKELAFSRRLSSGWSAQIRDLRTGVETEIARGGACRPAWSPDGKRLAYVNRSEGTHDIWITTSDGNAGKPVSYDRRGRDYDPDWSPDGAWIAFASTPYQGNENWDLYVVPADGGAARRLTTHLGNDTYPAWRPE